MLPSWNSIPAQKLIQPALVDACEGVQLVNTGHNILRLERVKSARGNDELAISELRREHKALSVDISERKPDRQTQRSQAFADVVSFLYHRGSCEM